MKKWNRGVVWRNDKLYVFEPNSILVMRLWPEMRAWRRTLTRPWSPTRKWADKALLEQDVGNPPIFNGSFLWGDYRITYRVTTPVRATLGIKRHMGGWEIDEIKGPCNQLIPNIEIEEIWCQLFSRY